MNTTPLFQIHEKLNAKFTEFNGWNMPLWFSSLEDEHLHVRDKIGIFDVSHMGEIEIVGDDAESFTDFIFTNNILNLKIGQARYGFICDFDAQVLDDVIVYNTEKDLEDIFLSLPIDVRIIGADYIDKDFTAKDICNERDIRIVYNTRDHSFSSTDLRERIKKV